MISPASGAALFWYVRNSLYFEMSLDEDPNTMLVSYDRFLAEPGSVARSMCSFLGLEFGPHLIAHVRPHRSARPEPTSPSMSRSVSVARTADTDGCSVPPAMAAPSRT